MRVNGADIISECDHQISAGFARELDTACVQRGLLPGQRVLIVDGRTLKTCECACGPQDGILPVATPSGEQPMSALGPGETVLAAGPALAWSPAVVRFSAGMAMTEHDGGLIRIEVATGSGTTLSVVPDHPFVAPDGRLVRAGELAIGDRVLLADGHDAAVVRCDPDPDYRGYVWRVATLDEEPTKLDMHLLNTAGIVSGDFAVQLFFAKFERESAWHSLARAGRVKGSKRQRPSTAHKPKDLSEERDRAALWSAGANPAVSDRFQLRPFHEFALMEEGRAELGATLGLDGPVSQQVFDRAMRDWTYARNLVSARTAPAFLNHLLDIPPYRDSDSGGATEYGPAVELLAKAARSLWVWSRAGLEAVSEETYRARLSGCASCPHHKPRPDRVIYGVAAQLDGHAASGSICSLCGCFTASKARRVTESCPDADPVRPALTRWGEPNVQSRIRTAERREVVAARDAAAGTSKNSPLPPERMGKEESDHDYDQG